MTAWTTVVLTLCSVAARCKRQDALNAMHPLEGLITT